MILRKWENLPPEMQCDEVRPYYDILRKKQVALIIKRLFDIIVSALMLAALSPLFLLLALAIKLDSKGSVFFRQVRVTQYGKHFRIFKFRTMVQDAEQRETQVTVQNDARITRVGRFLRKYRLDEISQLIDIFRGTMTFVGTRPETPKIEHNAVRFSGGTYDSENHSLLLVRRKSADGDGKADYPRRNAFGDNGASTAAYRTKKRRRSHMTISDAFIENGARRTNAIPSDVCVGGGGVERLTF